MRKKILGATLSTPYSTKKIEGEINPVKTVNGKAPDENGNVEVEIPENTNITESDPTVPAWAKQPTKPSYTNSEVGLGNVDNVKQYSASNPPPYPVTSVNGKGGAVTLSASDVGARPSSWTPTYSDVGADKSGTASTAISSHNTNTEAHNDLRLLIEGLSTRLNALANSTDNDLDQMAEVVAYIKANKQLIDSVTTSKVSVADVVDNLSTNVTNRPLSAAQGVALKALIDAITVPTKVSELANDAKYLTSFTEADPTVPSWAKQATKPSYSKSEVGLGNVDNVKQYSANNPPPYPVTSVNSKTGAVTLSASDVGARPSTWTPSASDVGAISLNGLADAINTALGQAKESGAFDGKNGYTPVRGTDYWTPTDEAEWSEYIASELAKRGQLKPEFAQSVEWLKENGDTSKLYVLPDGYIWAYLYKEITVEPENEIPKSTDMDRTSTYNGVGFRMKYRISSSGEVKTDADTPSDIGVTGFIPAKIGDVISVENYTYHSSYTSYIAAYDSSNNCTGKIQITSSTVFPFTLGTALGSNFNAIRISGKITADTKVFNLSNAGTIVGYQWSSTGHAFVPTDYEDRIIELEAEVETLNSKLKKASVSNLSVSEVFAPSPQLPADGSETADFNGDRDHITAELIYAKIDELLNLYPRFITKEVMGKDASGTHDWCRYVCSRRAYDAWQKPNYPPMYAWVNGSTVIYSKSVSPRIGDTLYTTTYIGTAKGTVTAVNNANRSRTVGGVVYTRDKSKDVAPTLVYTETAYSPYFSSNYAGLKNGIYDGAKSKISTISSMNNGTLTGANGVTYTRYPLGDRDSKFTEIPAIVIGANEHGTGGDPATPAMISARMVKDLCECKNMNNPFLNLLKNEYMMVFCPVVNPWGFHKNNKKYYNSNKVNIDRNFDTIGWWNEEDTSVGWNSGSYGGSESETQYFMNTLVASKCKLAMCNHSYGHGIDNTTGEAVSAGICSYMLGGYKPKYTESLLKIAEVMASNYNLVFNQNSDIATPETSAKTRSYFEAIGIDGVALEINSRDGFITDTTNEAQGKQFTARVMEAGYTQLLQVLYMMIDKQDD